MKQQLAVQWLIDEIRKLSHNENHHLGMGDIRISQGMLDELEEQAKEMEKNQIVKHSVELTKILISNPYEKSGKHPKELVDNYFNKTFKQQ